MREVPYAPAGMDCEIMILLIDSCGRCPFLVRDQGYGFPRIMRTDICTRGAKTPIRESIPEDCPLKVEEITYRLKDIK